MTLHLGYEATRDLALRPVTVTTPSGDTASASHLSDKIAIIPILRAGLGELFLSTTPPLLQCE